MSQNFRKFGKYILLEKLSSGGMAEIYLARSEGVGGVGKFVAIKTILPQFSNNPDFTAMFRAEAQLASQLSHGNVVSIIEFGQEQSQLFLVLDYVLGKNLRQLTQNLSRHNRQLAVQQVLFIIREAANGLDHAHRCLDSQTGEQLKIIHRDISPQNIMLNFESEVKILDFGIAKAIHDENTRSQVGQLKGKFSYMSPEQVEGADLDIRTDIFSLGVVMWELLTGQKLFDANNELNTLRKVRDCQIPDLKSFNPNIHPEITRVVNKILSKDRQQRYQTAASVSRDIGRILNQEYPDFSSHDLAAVMKTLYSSEIVKTREKQKKYVKLISQLKAKESSTADTPSKVILEEPEDEFLNQLDNEPTHSNSDVHMEVVEKTKASEGFQRFMDRSSSSNTDKPSKRDLETDVSQVVNRKPFLEDSTNTKSFHNYVRKTHLVDKPEFTKTVNRPRVNTVPPRKSSKFGSVLVSLIFLGALGGVYHYKKDYFQNVINKYTQIKDPVPKKESLEKQKSTGTIARQDKSVKKAAPAIGRVAIYVSSSPSGAEIYVNNKSTGRMTPSLINLDLGKTVDIKISKENYIPYEKNGYAVSFDNQKVVEAKLQKASLAFLDIEASHHIGTKVYINGKQLNKKLPITRYPIPAGKKNLIKLTNPVDSKGISQVIVLRRGARQSLSFKFIRKPAALQDIVQPKQVQKKTSQRKSKQP